MIDNEKLNLVLASQSQARKNLLTGAGIGFEAIASGIDEQIIKRQNAMLKKSPADTAQDLADAKAIFVSKVNLNKLVLGSDQICHLGGEILNKPKTKVNLFAHLKALSGQKHILTSAISIALNGDIIYRHKDNAHLTMYELSDDEINAYIQQADDDVVNAAGGYHLEACGVQLFRHIEGSYFTILGLPLLPLIEFLKQYLKKTGEK